MASQPATLFEANGSFGKYMFNVGAPETSMLRKVAELMQTATQKRLQDEISAEAQMMQYGAPEGDPRFLTALVKFLSEEYKEPIDECALVETAGATSGLFYMLAQMFPKRCTVYCEEMTYFIALNIMRMLEFNFTAVPLQSDGIDVAALERQWEGDLKDAQPKESDTFSAVLFLVPMFNNPTGTVLSEEKRHALIRLARKYNVLIISDDVYDLLYFPGSSPPRRLIAYDNTADPDYKGNVISNCSFSKLLSPGLRLGWMELPKWIRQKYWIKSPIVDSSGGISNYVGGVVAAALEDGSAAKLISETRQELAARCGAQLAVLDQDLPKQCQIYARPQGGYFIFIKLPPGANATALHVYTKEKYGIRFQEGWKFWSGDASKREEADRCLRLSWAYHQVPSLVEGTKLFCQAVHEYLADSAK
uniref:Aminotransferase class I/classII domain-containing protein n=1 Tax=Plectus sambesii TaxID=2011161 RepID=A0A914UIE7_9BILA